jgi:predicted acylesterase/phospholipase RssA
VACSQPGPPKGHRGPGPPHRPADVRAAGPRGDSAGQHPGLARLLREAIRDAWIEALAIRLAAVAVDLDTGKEVGLDRGPLVEAMLATSVFPPFLWEGQRLIEGRVLNPLPVDVARGPGATLVIRVDLSGPMRSGGDRRWPERLPGPLPIRWLTCRARRSQTL